MSPTPEQALQFAIMIHAGLPAGEAILYFVDSDDPHELASTVRKWQRSKLVKQATLQLMSKPWHQMSLDERTRYALDLHYSQLAHILFTNHYGEVDGATKTKMDTARQALEAKLAGMAGKGDALSAFMEDVRSGKIKLTRPVPLALPES